ncbi:MAG: RdgB/HAM1 family non-canonical purine NTP pyrophosphatase [Betaproteobacteria bacterium]|nr:RdgB/HAM1 family non-canonical purine NTP pyrophosphatase [Betaproteobacteria bacterium]
MKKLVIASGNPGKLREIERLLEPLGLEVLPQSVFNMPEAEEPHPTFLENCLAKARHAAEHSGLPALADDSGICVDALNGAPGVFSARFAGEQRSDSANNEKLLEALAHAERRSAHYYCVIVLVRYPQDPEPLIAEGRWDGEILREPRGRGGFGYDPLFLVPELGRTGAELALEEKNRISHRGKALAQLVEKLKARMRGDASGG